MRTQATLAFIALLASAGAHADGLFPAGPAGARGPTAAGVGWRAKTILEVPLRVRSDDAVRDSGAAMLLGKGLIVGIVVGAVVAVSVLSDDDDDGGGY